MGFLQNSERDQDLIAQRTAFLKLVDPDSKTITRDPTDMSPEERMAIGVTLNQIELASILIHKDILDYDIMRSYERGMYIAQWDASETFVFKLRALTGRTSTYEWAERLRRRLD